MSGGSASPMPPAAPLEAEWSACERRVLTRVVLAQCCGYSLLAAYAVVAERHLIADGVHFLLALWEHRIVAQWYPARQFAHTLTQYPAVALMDLGCRDVGLISAVYAATLHLIPVAGLAAGWWGARTAPLNAWLPLLFSAAAATLNTSLFMIGESHVTVALYWSLLSLLVWSERLTLLRGMVVLIASILIVRTNETFLFLAWPVIAAAVWRGWSAWRAPRRGEALLCAVCVMLALYGVVIALQAGLEPRDPGAREQYLKSLSSHFRYPPVWLTWGVLGLIVLWFRRPPQGWWGAGLWAAVLLLGLGVAAVPWLQPSGIQPHMQYAARVQNLYFPFALGSLWVWSQVRGDRCRLWSRRCPAIWWLTAGLALAAIVFQAGATYRWRQYVDVFAADLAEQRGLLPFTEAAISAGPARLPAPGISESAGETRSRERSNALRAKMERGALAQFNWGWTTPSLSIALSALRLGEVTTIVENADPNGWQPFDPRDPDAIPRLDDYGIPLRLPGAPATPFAADER